MRQRINKGIIGPQTYIGGLNTIADINLLSITGYIVTDSSYNNLDDTTVGTTGGYIKINGTGFSSDITVYINGSVVSSTYVNPGEIRAVVPTLAAGTYTIWVFKGSISAAFVSLVTSGFPSWTSSSYISSSLTVSVQLLATGDGTLTYSLYSGTLPSGLSLSSTGLISGTVTEDSITSNLVFLVNDSQNQTTQQTVTLTITTNDIYWKNTTAILQGDTAPFISDASTNAFAVTPSGDVRPYNFNPYTPGYYSNYFDGTGDYLDVAGGASLNSTGDFTLEAWAFITSSSTYQGIVSLSTSANAYGGRINVDNTGCVSYAISPGGYYASTLCPINQWFHVALVRSGSATNNCSCYLNGTRVAQFTSTSQVNTASNLTVGRYYADSAAYYTSGYVSNVRYVIGSALYSGATMTVPTTPLTAVSGTVVLTCQSNRLIDNSTNAFTITKAGDTSVKPNHPFTPNSSYAAYGSGYFDGTGDYLAISNASLALNTGDFTLECWINATTGLTDKSIFEGRTGGTGTTGFTLTAISSTSIRIYSGSALITSGSINYVNTWCHVAVVRLSGTTTLYINGVSQGTTASLGNLTDSSFVIGAGKYVTPPTVDAFFTGYISNFRIVKGTAVYTAAFTPPTTPLTAISGTSLLTLQTNLPHNNNTILDNSTNDFAVTRSGSPVQGTFSPYSGYYSNYFDGTGDYLSAPNVAFDSSNFTIEGWFYPTTIANLTNFWGMDNGSGSTPKMLMYINSSGNLTVDMGNAGTTQFPLSASASTYLSLNTWNHIAIVRSGTGASQFALYINGISVSTGQLGTNISSITASFNIGYIGEAYGQPFSGYISNFRIVKGTAVYTGAFTPPTTLLATSQSSGTNIAALTTIGSVNNKSVYFDGSGDYLSLSMGSNGNLSSGNFTIELWFYATISGATSSLIQQGEHAWRLNIGSNLIGWVTQGAGRITSSSSYTTGIWNHVAVVTSGATTTLYLNGNSVGTTTIGPASGTLPIAIGMNTASIGNVWDYSGYISNVRIVKGTAVYTGTFTPPTTPLTAITNTVLLTCQSPTIRDNSTNAYTITVNGNAAVNYTTSPFSIDAVSLLTCQSNRLIDNSTNAFTITKAGDVSVKPFSPFGRTSEYSIASNGGSVYFNGSTDYLSIINSSAFAPAALDFTIEAWVYITALTAGSQTIFGQADSAGSIASGIYFYACTASGYPQLASPYGGSNNLLTSTTAIKIQEWNHIAVARYGATITIYVNGVASGTIGFGSLALIASTQTNSIGRNGAGNFEYLNGYISNFRFVKGTAVYTAAFTPPTSPVAAIQNTSLLIDGTSGAVIDKTTNGNILTSADARVLNTQYKYGSGSLYFDGTGDYMTMPYETSLYDWWQSDFTIEAWVYPVSLATWQYTDGALTNPCMIGNNAQGGTGNYWSFGPIADGTVKFYYYTGATQSKSSTATITTAAWSHIAMSKTSSGITIFVNGIASTTTAVSGTPQSGTGIPLTIGRGNSVSINGYVDDLRITRGYARYVANFTVPSLVFKAK